MTNARSFNTLLGILILVQVTFLIIIVSLLIAPVISPDVQLPSTMAIAFMLLLCLPMSLYLYWKSTNRDQKLLFLSLFLTHFLLVLTTLIWFILPQLLNDPWLVNAGKAFGIIVYLPVLLAFLYLIYERQNAKWPDIYFFIIFLNVISAMTIILFTAMNFSEGRSDAFSVLVYVISIVLDIAILSLGSMLAFTSMENELRYILSIPICAFLFSLAGDVLMLMDFLGLYDTIGYAQVFYDGMLFFAGLAMLFFALGNVNVTTIEEVNKKLFDAKRLMSDLVMQSPDAICIFDVDGYAVLANQTFIRFTGKSQGDVIGKMNLFRDTDQYVPGSSDKVAEIRNDEIPRYEGVTQMLAADGGKMYYSVKVFPTYDSEGKVSSYIVMMVDVTESKNHEEKLRAAKNEAELYLDLMSHDINNMDQIALGFLELAIDRPDLSSETRELISRPMDALASSTSLIRNVQKLQQVRDNGYKLYEMDIGRVLHDAVQQYSNIPGRDVTIRENIRDDCKVMANNLLSDVFSNLIGNAVKHSKGHITIGVHMDKVRENGSTYCRIRFEDDGPGIPDELKARIFDRFQKGSARASGKGLGLYLVKKLVEIYHGRVWVEDRVPGDSAKGSCFVVMLPAIE
ncbi:putative histidine kinase [Methanocella paludicola SANAE]|uniref:histidine kinase n=1 Tax=Methanocella paludicola (strain DSM 17711 / JCM 13418 / NBRC 101707 / SANAE) TaxID=304371 RepID=D1Z0P3_METPS|nr:PAS domain-containing sensor histidine kinase [Methanocella paludicola]BAI62265.1 putative histidine kinase [Methanocella paludicola SANAE]